MNKASDDIVTQQERRVDYIGMEFFLEGQNVDLIFRTLVNS